MGDRERVAEDQVTERAMMRLEAEADVWLAEFPEIGQTVTRLATLAPLRFQDRAAAQIDALVRQTFVEAFYRGFNAHKDGAALRSADTGRAGDVGAMREACAKVCEGVFHQSSKTLAESGEISDGAVIGLCSIAEGATMCAAAIRALPLPTGDRADG